MNTDDTLDTLLTNQNNGDGRDVEEATADVKTPGVGIEDNENPTG